MKPPAVASNAAISIVAPASPAKPERVELGLASATLLGFTPKPGQNALQNGPLYFAGTPAQRLADLHAAFADPDTSAVMALRGGYGSNYLLDGLNPEIIADTPQALLCLQRSDRHPIALAR